MRCCVEVDVGNCWCDVYVFLEFCNDICELSGLDWELVVANYIVVGVLQRVLARCRSSREWSPQTLTAWSPLLRQQGLADHGKRLDTEGPAMDVALP